MLQEGYGVKPIAISRALKFNKNHAPAGSSKGGQFIRSKFRGSTAPTKTVTDRLLLDSPKSVTALPDTVVVYHGTTTKFLQKIMKEGLRPKKSNPRGEENEYTDGSLPPGVFVTSDLDNAFEYARDTNSAAVGSGYRGKYQAIILKFTLPRELAAKFKLDATDEEAVWSSEPIPPEYITGALKYKLGDSEDASSYEELPLPKVKKGDSKDYYLVVFIDEGKPEPAKRKKEEMFTNIFKFNKNHEPAGSSVGGRFARSGSIISEPTSSFSAPTYAPRQEGETDKAYAKRVVDNMPAPTELPSDDLGRYFTLEGATIVPIENLQTSKTDEENAQGLRNGPKRLRAAYDGILSKREPITVMPGQKEGTYDVVDGNGTYVSAKAYGFKKLPVQVVSREKGTAILAASLAKDKAKKILKFNPYHDPKDGRFTTGEKGKSSGGKTKPAQGGSPENQRVAEPKGPYVSEPRNNYSPDVNADADGDGVTDAARVGVPASEVPPPPKIPRLPNLKDEEARAQETFASAYEQDPDKMAEQFRQMVYDSKDPTTFGTDDAKALSEYWTGPEGDDRSQRRARLNVALHQTANAVAKRAFLQHLDTLKKGDNIMVTVGGCGAGKGFALKKVPKVKEMRDGAQAVWDSAGDQNATENPWIQKEAEKRGLKVTYVYVQADPRVRWADPEMGVVQRANNPSDGRMVDANVFVDSYVLGARNHAAFAKKNANNPNASFVYLESAPGGIITQHPSIPSAALAVDRDELLDFTRSTVKEAKVGPHIKEGALIGQRIWGDK